MAKIKEDPAGEVFANIRMIMVFVVFGSTIVAFVEYHSQTSAEKTHIRWKDAIESNLENDSTTTVSELNSMIFGFPRKTDSQDGMPDDSKEEDDETDEKENSKEEAESKSTETKKSNSGAKIINYTWAGLFSKSFITVSMGGGDDPKIFRISAVQH